jgi:hypothetical protein
MAIKIPNGCKIDQHLPLQDPSKFTQIGIFVFKKIYHLANLINFILSLEVAWQISQRQHQRPQTNQ